MDILDLMREQAFDDLAHIEDDIRIRSFVVQNTISEELGDNKAVELDPATGAVTLLDSERGVTLSAVQVLLLVGFVQQHEDVIARSAFNDIEAVEAVIGE